MSHNARPATFMATATRTLPKGQPTR
ncbi:hypothetical protein CLIM01_07504 [Colletotrichum limetticola]|uniref:Uncharacterized protein n=1 Tax=Colletotrichum limetticola TaxID=1209924 RepID=A0ABQ9PUB1_9PEZI|nr:hypothetical protein CLIM01_07504 [Colletotrichum limetticola]